MDPKKGLGLNVEQLLTNNILQCLGSMLDTVRAATAGLLAHVWYLKSSSECVSSWTRRLVASTRVFRAHTCPGGVSRM